MSDSTREQDVECFTFRISAAAPTSELTLDPAQASVCITDQYGTYFHSQTMFLCLYFEICHISCDAANRVHIYTWYSHSTAYIRYSSNAWYFWVVVSCVVFISFITVKFIWLYWGSLLILCSNSYNTWHKKIFLFREWEQWLCIHMRWCTVRKYCGE